MAGFYEFQLAVITVVCVLSLLIERQVSKTKTAKTSPEDRLESGNSKTAASKYLLSRQYLLVYAYLRGVGADWLQGAYVYSLYQRIVAVLFVTGFLSAGITAPLVAVRKKACVAINIPWLPVLLVGRLLGGLSTSILFSAFETWLISSANAISLPQADLSVILGRATLVNSFVGTASGILSNELVATTNNFASPFIASGVLLALGFVIIRSTWGENYGVGGGTNSTDSDIFQLRRLGQAWRIVKGDPRLLVIGLTQTCFEGSMYIFVFQWVPLLQEASKTFPTESIPLGYVFSAFMMSMMLGSLAYTSIVSHIFPPGSGANSDSSLVLHAKLSSLVCAFSALALGTSISSSNEQTRFWAFCVFEACVGMYYPIQGMLRGSLISNEHRATLSAVFRVPLNVFVVVSLLTGVSSARYAVMTASALMLTVSSIMTGVLIVGRGEETPAPLTRR
ncbi:hypothetical protein DL96DRAFT_1595013 [Flagelloscypha sp. PMI_526]|nr:hypothetical protein DL96DRAFT_1595013 [Flagelloscypha sp. PMI_526]